MLPSEEPAGQKQQGSGSSPHIGYFCRLQREEYYFADEKIIIQEGLDSYAGMIWPAVSCISVKLSTRFCINLIFWSHFLRLCSDPSHSSQALALCHYLDSNRQSFNLVDKAVLELGAGTGLVSVVAALLGERFLPAAELVDPSEVPSRVLMLRLSVYRWLLFFRLQIRNVRFL